MTLDAIAPLRHDDASAPVAAPPFTLPAGWPVALPTALLGGLPIASISREASAELLVAHALSARGRQTRPLYVTSANGQVLSACASDPATRRLFEAADLIHADGQPMVVASRLLCRAKLPERVATTDFFHDVAARAQRTGASFYLLGATAETIAKAAANVRRAYPSLRLLGYHDGYVAAADEAALIDAIDALQPDFLWIGMGVPREQAFVSRNIDRMRSVGVIKTSGGLFDFLSGNKRRAPHTMQRLGLEWLFRMVLEPRRLAWRYFVTSPHAFVLMMTRSS